jgi:hypothetical protein
MKIETYTSIFGEKDPYRSDIKVFKDFNKFTTPVMNAKIYKILPHKWVDCDVSIWIDGNIYLNVSPEQLVEEFLMDEDMAVSDYSHDFSRGSSQRFPIYLLKHPFSPMFWNNAPIGKKFWEKQKEYQKKLLELIHILGHSGVKSVGG